MSRATLVLGLPASGKSTFIAALGHILLTQDVETELRLELGDDEAYIISLQKRWLRYEVLEHTPTGTDNWVKFNLISNSSGKEFLVELPDFSGESLKNAIATGIYPSELFAALGNADGIFLFTNAAGKVDDILLNDLCGIFPSASPDGVSPAISSDADLQDGQVRGGKEIAFDPLEMPEQPKLVQLLQTISQFSTRRRKLVVMVSAWDVVTSGAPDAQPAEWLQSNRAMLWQYLNHNSSEWDTRVYGVSAQGGRIPEDKPQLKKLSRASHRVKVVGYDAKTHDLTAPLAWLAKD